MSSGERQHFTWQTGVQLRGNLDLLQEWVHNNGLKEEANLYLRKLENLASLLAIPQTHLVKVTQSSFLPLTCWKLPFQRRYIVSARIETATGYNSHFLPRLQITWTQLHKDFPELNRNQLNYILEHYDLGGSRMPFDWNPPLREEMLSRKAEYLTESFKNHPPLVLPGDGFLLNLSEDPCESLRAMLHDLHRRFHPGDRGAFTDNRRAI